MQYLLIKLKNINMYLNRQKIVSVIILCLYVILLCFVSYYHEPWHDEGQAWLIARDDSLWHLITVTTHWEGHPPLWHLILMPLAKAGVPFEIGVKFINIMFSTLAMSLLLLKSSMPWYIRFALPFTYFCFYQYGVVNRTYSLFMFGMMLAAYYYPLRKEKPYYEAIALMLVSGSMAYGMMLALGIALAWLCDIIKDNGRLNWKLLDKLCRQNRECHALLVLLVVSSFWVLTMIPLRETAYTAMRPAPFWQNLFYSVFVLPSQYFHNFLPQDNMYDFAFTFFESNIKGYFGMISQYGIYAYTIIIQYILSYLYGFFSQIFLLIVASYLGLGMLFILPSCCFYILASIVFINNHHIGILFIFNIFIVWQIFSVSPEKSKKFSTWFANKFTDMREYMLIKICLYLVLFGTLGINIYWSLFASVVDYRYEYDISQSLANYLKQEHLLDRSFWVGWTYYDNDTRAGSGSHNINAYFDCNKIQNLNGGLSPWAFLEYRTWDAAVYNDKLRALGQPEMFFGDITLMGKIFPKAKKYVPVKEFWMQKAYKDHIDSINGFLFVRADIMSQLPQLKPLDLNKIKQ